MALFCYLVWCTTKCFPEATASRSTDEPNGTIPGSEINTCRNLQSLDCMKQVTDVLRQWLLAFIAGYFFRCFHEDGHCMTFRTPSLFWGSPWDLPFQQANELLSPKPCVQACFRETRGKRSFHQVGKGTHNILSDKSCSLEKFRDTRFDARQHLQLFLPVRLQVLNQKLSDVKQFNFMWSFTWAHPTRSYLHPPNKTTITETEIGLCNWSVDLLIPLQNWICFLAKPSKQLQEQVATWQWTRRVRWGHCHFHCLSQIKTLCCYLCFHGFLPVCGEV